MLVLGNPSQGMQTRSKLRNLANCAFVSLIEPKSYDEAKHDEDWIIAIQEELNQFDRNNVWTLVPRPKDHPIIG